MFGPVTRHASAVETEAEAIRTRHKWLHGDGAIPGGTYRENRGKIAA